MSTKYLKKCGYVSLVTALTLGVVSAVPALAQETLHSPTVFSATQATPKVASPGTLAEGDVVYQVLVDRFYDGNKNNNDLNDGAYDPNDLGFYHGGDWAGLTQKLDYIQNLGVTAIWISPVSEQEPLSKDKKEASYHGFFTKNFATPNKHFGDRKELQQLIDTAHKKGLKIILDVVPNHTADYLDPSSNSYIGSYRPASPLDDPVLFHHSGDCRFDNSETQQQLNNCDLGGLDDLDQDNPKVNEYLMRVYKDWVSMGFDGLRVDAARSIPKPWLKKFEQEMGIPTFGEIFVGDTGYVADYQKYQWGELDFPYFFTVRKAFSADTSMRELSTLFADDSKYVDANKLETFIDNHDRARFLTWANDDYQRLRSALSFMMTSRGIPIIYYGTEQADDGNGNGNEVPIANKDNRKDMTSFDEHAPIYKHIQRLNKIKKAIPALATGKQREMWVDDEVYAFSRIDTATASEAITVSSNSFTKQERTIPIRSESDLEVGQKLTNQLNTTQQFEVVAGGITGKQIKVQLDEHETVVLGVGKPAGDYLPMERNLTKIIVHANVGFGHNIAIRGSDYPLSWEYGRAARNIAPDLWEFDIERFPEGKKFTYKVLVDDKWELSGNTFNGIGGESNEATPR